LTTCRRNTYSTATILNCCLSELPHGVRLRGGSSHEDGDRNKKIRKSPRNGRSADESKTEKRETEEAQGAVKRRREGTTRMGKCQYRAGCDKQSVFGDKGQEKPKWCGLHRNSSHVDLRNPRCTYEDCDHRRVYGPPPASGGVDGGPKALKSKPLYCFRHKGPDDIDLVHKTCRHIEGCRKNPCFGSPGDRQARFCQVVPPCAIIPGSVNGRARETAEVARYLAPRSWLLASCRLHALQEHKKHSIFNSNK